MNPSLPDATEVRQALLQVIDPEIGCNVLDLGLIYDVRPDGDHLEVTMTLTTQGCPMNGPLTEGVRHALLAVNGVRSVDVNLVWDPPWTPDRISAEGRRFLHLC